jgi:hypothetical protein
MQPVLAQDAARGLQGAVIGPRCRSIPCLAWYLQRWRIRKLAGTRDLLPFHEVEKLFLKAAVGGKDAPCCDRGRSRIRFSNATHRHT